MSNCFLTSRNNPANMNDSANMNDPASQQLLEYKLHHQGHEGIITTKTGRPVGINTAPETIDRNGRVLLQDSILLDKFSSFHRERIPERVVHAKGTGAYGEFHVTHDITQYCAAKLFSAIEKKTPVFVRFSTTVLEPGSADTVRDTRGFAIKFYTEEGIWDLVGLNTPVFSMRDPMLFPDRIHSQKRNPATNLVDPNMIWDFVSLRPENIHQTLIVYADRGIPYSYRHMHGFGVSTFKMVNDKAEINFVKFHFITDQGIKNLSTQQAMKLAGENPDFATRDLYNAIAEGNYPSWKFCIQAMSPQEVKQCDFNPFDSTKIWPESQYPLIRVGDLVLNRNPSSFFVDVEQSAFSPASLVPGIEPSQDKILQVRLFSYGDTQLHRLGPNFQQIPVNCPLRKPMNYQRGGVLNVTDDQDGAPNYFPNSFCGPIESTRAEKLTPEYSEGGEVYRFDTGNDDNYSQPRIFYSKVLSEEEKGRLVDNLVASLRNAAPFIQRRMVNVLENVHSELAARVAKSLPEVKAWIEN